MEHLLNDEQIAILNELSKPKKRRLRVIMVSSSEDRFSKIRMEIKQQDKKLQEMNIKISSKKTMHYCIRIFGEEKIISRTEYLEYTALNCNCYTILK